MNNSRINQNDNSRNGSAGQWENNQNYSGNNNGGGMNNQVDRSRGWGSPRQQNSNALRANEEDELDAIETVKRIAKSNATAITKPDFTFNGKIEQINMVALCDSGSDISIIDAQLLKKLPKKRFWCLLISIVSLR